MTADHEFTNGTPAPIGRFALLANLIPLALLAAGTFLAVRWGTTPARSAAIFAAWLYLAPPLIARVLMALRGKPEAVAVGQDSPEFRTWWLLIQLQMPFSRLRFLEELLRLVPAVYPLWLRLWGSRIALRSLWTPGVALSDRTHLEVGENTIIGGDTWIGAHLAYLDEAGVFRVTIAPVRIGSGAVVGARVTIGPGCVIEDGEMVTACSRLAPFQIHRGGKRRNRGDSSG